MKFNTIPAIIIRIHREYIYEQFSSSDMWSCQLPDCTE